MAMNQQELVDTLAGLALFADLNRPQIEAVAHKMTEESYPTGQRILRQGFTGTGFYVIVEGEVAVRIDGNEIARLGKGDFFGEMSILLGEPPNADIVTTRQLRVSPPGRPRARGFPARLSTRPAAHDQDDRHAPAQRKPMAELGARPFPPGDYPVVVVGSGPGGIQASYYLRHLGIEHALHYGRPMCRAACSAASRSSSACFRGPSLMLPCRETTPSTSGTTGTPCWPRSRAAARSCPSSWTARSSFPSRPEMERNLATFAERAGLHIRFDCTLGVDFSRDGESFVLHTSDGDYRCQVAIFAVGVAKPFKPDTPGIEHAVHYAHMKPAGEYAGKRLFIVGKENSAFELANGLLPWAQRIVLASPRPAKMSINSNSLAGVRARYVQPVEDQMLGGGVFILNASIARIERDRRWLPRALPAFGGRRGA